MIKKHKHSRSLKNLLSHVKNFNILVKKENKELRECPDKLESTSTSNCENIIIGTGHGHGRRVSLCNLLFDSSTNCSDFLSISSKADTQKQEWNEYIKKEISKGKGTTHLPLKSQKYNIRKRKKKKKYIYSNLTLR